MIPALLVGFNRPNELQRVLEALTGMPIAKLYIWLDGPRAGYPEDSGLCAQVRELASVHAFEFPVRLKALETNLGCRDSVSQAISWFFALEERGVILEDDCVPTPSFFTFMIENLEKYADDATVFSVAGHVYNREWQRLEHSYHFSKYPHIWGWGTWRRVWKNYDAEMRRWPELRQRNWLRTDTDLRPDARRYWTYTFNKVWRRELNTWDHQFTFLSLLEQGKNILPHVNLVENIGFGSSATHTVQAPHPLVATETGRLSAQNHPSDQSINELMDRETELKLLRTKRPLGELLLILLRRLGSQR